MAWFIAEVEPGGARARLEPGWATAEIARRLDAEVGVGGWSHALEGAGGAGIVCTLTIEGASRGAVAGGLGERARLEGLAELAFTRAARRFGIAPAVMAVHDSYWVDFDEEARQPLYEPEPVPAEEQAPLTPSGHAPAADSLEGAPNEAEGGEGEPAPGGGAPTELLAMIERLVDRLREAGLGKEAAQLVARHHGGGPEEARELYGRLRKLLLSSGAAQG